MTDLLNSERNTNKDRTQQYMYAISHDLLGATRHIKSFARLLDSHLGDELDEQSRGYMGHISVAATELQAKVESLARLSRATGAGTSHQPRPCKVGAILDDALALLEPTIVASNAAITLEVAGAVLADHDQVVSVFVELIGNSLRFCDSPAKVRLTSEVVAGHCHLTIADSGPGFTSRRTGAAFDLFKTFHHASVSGTGTGLAMVRAILDQHGADVSIDSDSMAGTTVEFRLPVPLTTSNFA